MPAQTGRTPSKFLRFVIGDSTNVLREVPVTRIGEVGLTAPEVDVSAIQDAVKGFLSGQDDFELEIEGPFDTSAAVAAGGSGVAPALSGSHTVLQPLYQDLTPRTLDIRVGIRQFWQTGEPQFGISRSATSGVIVTKYHMRQDGDNVNYVARLRLFPGSAAPAWGTAAET